MLIVVYPESTNPVRLERALISLTCKIEIWLNEAWIEQRG